MLAEAGDAIVAGVERELPAWVRGQVERILDAWGRIGGSERREAERAAAVAGDAAAHRVVAALRALFATDVSEQRATPLEIVRTAYREPMAVLAAAGVPPV